MNNIIDNIEYLLKITDIELEDLLLDEKYNKANLRELIKRLIACYKNQIIYTENIKKKLNIFKDKLNAIKDIISD